MAALSPVRIGSQEFLGEIPLKTPNNTVETRRKTQVYADKCFERANRIKNCVSSCFTWGHTIPCVAVIVGLFVAMLFPHFVIGAAAGTAAAFALAGIAWAATYLLGAILLGISYCCSPSDEEEEVQDLTHEVNDLTDEVNEITSLESEWDEIKAQYEELEMYVGIEEEYDGGAAKFEIDREANQNKFDGLVEKLAKYGDIDGAMDRRDAAMDRRDAVLMEIEAASRVLDEQIEKSSLYSMW